MIRGIAVNCAVAIVLTRETPARVLLIQRAIRPGDPWSGHMAFPGGRKSGSDQSLQETAHRETYEETGINLPDPSDFPSLRDWITKSHSSARPMTVTPFVYYLDAPCVTSINHEVAEIVWLPLDVFRQHDIRKKMRWKIGRISLPVQYVPYENRRVWGLTLAMIDDLVGRLD